MGRSSWKAAVKLPVAQAVHDQDLNLERLYMTIVDWHHITYCMYFKNHNLQWYTDSSHIIAVEETVETNASQKVLPQSPALFRFGVKVWSLYSCKIVI